MAHATFIVAGAEDMWRRPPLAKGTARVEWNLTPFEVRSLPSGDSGLIGGLNGYLPGGPGSPGTRGKHTGGEGTRQAEMA